MKNLILLSLLLVSYLCKGQLTFTQSFAKVDKETSIFMNFPSAQDYVIRPDTAFSIHYSPNLLPGNVKIIGLQFSPDITNSKIDFKSYIKSILPIKTYDSIAKNWQYKKLVSNSNNEVIQVRVKITGQTRDTIYNKDYSFKEFRKLVYELPLPASASITIIITDSGTSTLVDIRDTLCLAWGYTGAQNDSAAKLAFLKSVLINKIVNDYGNYKALQAQQITTNSINATINVQ